jgi:hypothetical protein
MRLEGIFHLDNKLMIQNAHNIPLVINNLSLIIANDKALVNKFQGIEEPVPPKPDQKHLTEPTRPNTTYDLEIIYGDLFALGLGLVDWKETQSCPV